MLYKLSLNNQAPQIFTRVSKNHLPGNAVIFTVIIAFVTVILNYTIPQQILMYLFAMITVAIIISWYFILLAHIFYRYKKATTTNTIEYCMPFYPYTNILVMIILMVILITMAYNKDMRLSVLVAPFWLLILFLGYKLTNKYYQKLE